MSSYQGAVEVGDTGGDPRMGSYQSAIEVGDTQEWPQG